MCGKGGRNVERERENGRGNYVIVHTSNQNFAITTLLTSTTTIATTITTITITISTKTIIIIIIPSMILLLLIIINIKQTYYPLLIKQV